MIRRAFVCMHFLPLLAGGCDPAPKLPAGVVAVFGGTGLASGLFNYPRAIAADGGHIFVVDRSGRVQRFSPDGKFETGWRMPETRFGVPVGLAVHPDGRLFIADTHNHRVMVYDRNGISLGAIGKPGVGDGEFGLPTDVAFDRHGFVYVSEYYGNDRITKWSPDLRFVRAFGVTPVDGLRLNRPTGLIVDDEDTVWVADACHHRLVRFDTEGNVLTTFGRFGVNPGEMRYPYDISLSPEGTLMVCEYEGARLQWFSKDGRSLRIWGRHGRKPGELFSPWGATYGPGGRVYIVDSLNNRVQVIKP